MHGSHLRSVVFVQHLTLYKPLCFSEDGLRCNPRLLLGTPIRKRNNKVGVVVNDLSKPLFCLKEAIHHRPMVAFKIEVADTTFPGKLSRRITTKTKSSDVSHATLQSPHGLPTRGLTRHAIATGLILPGVSIAGMACAQIPLTTASGYQKILSRDIGCVRSQNSRSNRGPPSNHPKLLEQRRTVRFIAFAIDSKTCRTKNPIIHFV